MALRVRFAPSPTGELHVGGARTALFNWLWARKEGGTFVLRIEDTDLARSQARYTQGIMDALSWLGLTWDELFYQSKRLPLYREYVERLVEGGKAYPCFCTPEELAERKRKALARGEAPEYDGRCRHLSPAERQRYLRAGRKPAIRFLVPEEAKETSFTDFLRGEVKFRRLTTGDFVIQKADGTPTYNLACVVDDHELGITHVLRAEDHISNTPKQIWLYRAFGWEPPAFGHLSIILGPDRKKLSKRHGATSVEALREAGYLPEAVVNHLALLGWSPDSGEEVFTLEELVERFSLAKVNLAPQVFDLEKLRWLNRKHLARLSPGELLERARPFLSGYAGVPEGRLAAALELLRPGISTLSELVGHPDLGYLLGPLELSPQVVEELSAPPARAALRLVLSRLGPDFSPGKLRPLVRAVAAELGVPPRGVFHPLRLALTGRDRGPELAGIVGVLGMEEMRARLEEALRLVEEGPEGR
ncbi:TPA: glutamate--tRNA ligase [Candidatus Bipolaricaulota bacterium]|nr:glutamate--tRNA ligase [Candidatus Bipolaricaulota bacterium]